MGVSRFLRRFPEAFFMANCEVLKSCPRYLHNPDEIPIACLRMGSEARAMHFAGPALAGQARLPVPPLGCKLRSQVGRRSAKPCDTVI